MTQEGRLGMTQAKRLGMTLLAVARNDIASEYNPIMSDGLRFRWLGTAGVELEFRGERILIDPYVSRFPFRFTFSGRAFSRRDLVERYVRPARAVLVSHAHFDHLLDVPSVCRNSGSTAYGSPNAGAILRVHGIPEKRVRVIRAGEAFSEGPFDISAYKGEHGRMLGVLPYAGPLAPQLKPPLRLSDYRMDGMFSFRVKAGEETILVWNHPDARKVPRADCLFYCLQWGGKRCAAVARAAQAKAVVPLHWDDFFSPLDRPLRPLILPPGWNSPWFQRMDPHAFARLMKQELPEVPVYLPALFHPVSLLSLASL
jgi:L-ascorbate metabolism protein UlaG (beta-lactamase superfamily)